MSMSVQEGLLLNDGKAGMYIAEEDLDQLVCMRPHYPLNLSQCPRFVVRHGNVGIIVRAEIFGPCNLSKDADLGLGFVRVVEISEPNQAGVEGSGLADIPAVTVALKTQRFIDHRQDFGANGLDWRRGSRDVGEIEKRLLLLLLR